MIQMKKYGMGFLTIIGKQSGKLSQMDRLAKFTYFIMIEKGFLLPKINLLYDMRLTEIYFCSRSIEKSYECKV